jgi:hypothetical protein
MGKKFKIDTYYKSINDDSITNKTEFNNNTELKYLCSTITSNRIKEFIHQKTLFQNNTSHFYSSSDIEITKILYGNGKIEQINNLKFKNNNYEFKCIYNQT